MIQASEPQLQQKARLAELCKVASFVLMTNVSKESALAREVFRFYKEQKKAEDTFSVIKRPVMAGYPVPENQNRSRHS